MAGGHMKYRTLGRTSSHRQHLLRNLVTALFQHESIRTTWAKAKEAQRLAEKLVTLGKRNTPAARMKAQGIVYDQSLLPRIFGAIRERYATRPGGYTRVLRIEPFKGDNAESAILELVDSPVDTRMALVARTLARCDRDAEPITDITEGNVVKVTRFRKDGEAALIAMVKKFEDLQAAREKEENDLEEAEDMMEGSKRGRKRPEPAGEEGITG